MDNMTTILGSKELVEIILGLHVIFNDESKVAAWISTPNLNFGGASPAELISKKRGYKVLKFIDSALRRYDQEDPYAVHKELQQHIDRMKDGHSEPEAE